MSGPALANALMVGVVTVKRGIFTSIQPAVTASLQVRQRGQTAPAETLTLTAANLAMPNVHHHVIVVPRAH